MSGCKIGRNTESRDADHRIHINEVIRALINRNPKEIWISPDVSCDDPLWAPFFLLVERRAIPLLLKENLPSVAVAVMG